MHGRCSTAVLLVNAEVYSMGGVVEGVGTPNRTSPRQAAIQKVQAELRQEYGVREERKRELEFLEKGGNPLDFNLGSVGSISVQSTSYTDQHPAQIVTSEAKGSFAVTTSAHGDSVESSGDRNSLHPSRNSVVPSEQSSQMDGSQKALELGDSAAFDIPRKSYRRRYRSRPNRDGTRPSSTDVNSTHGSHASFVPSRQGPKDVKGLVSDPEDLQLDMKSDNVKAVVSSRDLNDAAPQDTGSDAIASRNTLDELPSLPGGANTSFQLNSNGPETIQRVEEMASAVDSKAVKRAKSCQINGFSSKEDGMLSSVDNNSVPRGIKGSDVDTHTNLSTGRNDSDTCTKMGTVESKGTITNQILAADNSQVIEGGELIKDKKEAEVTSSAPIEERMDADCHQLQNGSKLFPDEELDLSGPSLKNSPKDHNTTEGMEARGPTGPESDRMYTDLVGLNPVPGNETCNGVSHQDCTDSKIPELAKAGSLTNESTVSAQAETSKSESKMTEVVDEDSILEEAEIIEAKRKRLMELSMMTSPTEMRQKSQWEYVLEEMAWLANDFAQERIWKVSAAARVCYQAAFTSRLRKQEQFSGMAGKKVAHTLAKSVMEFWHSVEEKCKEFEQQSQKDGMVSIQAYALRFLKYNNSSIIHDQAEMPATPDRLSDLGTVDLSWEDSLTEENLFYSISPGAMEAYRKSIESYVDMRERIGGSVQPEVETSPFDTVADFDSQDNVYYEDEVETNTFDGNTARFGQRKWKDLKHAFGPKSYAVGSTLLPIHGTENKRASLEPALLVKRPGSSLNVSIPTKRVRTASRRVISPFTAGTSGYIQFPNKTDASSGDTDSYQDDQSTLRGGSLAPNTFDTESVGDFENQLTYDTAEVSMKLKKKKKTKHPNAERWQVNSGFQHEQFQRDQLKRKPESRQLDSNCSSGFFGQPVIKKPKIIRPSQDNSFNNITHNTGSVPSPAASQMSNMSNPNKFIKMLGGRDRGRKSKAHKVPSGQPGSGRAWSKLEEQALVVLVHDLGPNWELVSDAFNNNTFHFKCLFRKAQECKEHHKLLLDRTSGDGADSAEDSGSSQPYPSTLPGIPKGSAVQLFHRLQGPSVEDTLKAHFEKITVISQKLYSNKAQVIEDPHKKEPPHSSHAMALSQVCPNNLNGGPILTPLDLCAATISGPDILSPVYQGPHSSGLAIPSDPAVTPILPATATNSALQGSQNMMLGNSLSPSPGPFSSVRDGRYGVPRSASLSAEDQQRMQQYNYMASNRNLPPSNISPIALPGIDRGMRIRPGSSGMGMAVNRNMPSARPGGQGFVSSPVVNSGSMVSPSMASAAMHSGVGSSQGSSMVRPREASNIMRDSRKMVGPDAHMPGNSQAVSHFGGLSSSAPNQTGSPSYTVHHQPSRPVSPLQPQVLNPHHPHFQGPTNHVPSPQQQAYAIHLAKERQLQQRSLPQQLGSSNSLMPPHLQTQPQIPASSPMQSGSQVHAQTSSQVSLSPSTPSSSMNSMSKQKHPKPTQTVKQRQKQQQQLSQSNRKHPQQSQAQQQGKIAKGVGKGNLKMNHNIPIDPSLLNGISANPVNQPTNLVQGQGSYTGPVPQTVQPKRHHVPSQSSNHPLPQQNMYPGPALKLPDNSTQGHIPSVALGVSAGHQSIPSVSVAGLNHQQATSHQKLMNQNQLPIQRVAPNRQINSDLSNKQQARESDADLHSTSSSLEMDTGLTLPQACNSTTTAVRIISPARTHQQQPPDHFLASKALNSAENMSSLASQPRHPPLQHEQPVPMLHSHQQAHLLQAGNGNLYGRPSEPGVE